MLYILFIFLHIILGSFAALLTLKGKTRFFSLLVAFGVLLLIQLIYLFYGLFGVDSTFDSFGETWSSLTISDSVTNVENTLHCCGFTDTQTSVSYSCEYDVPCGPIIEEKLQQRKRLIISLDAMSILFQLFNAYAIYLMKDDGPEEQYSEFDSLQIVPTVNDV